MPDSRSPTNPQREAICVSIEPVSCPFSASKSAFIRSLCQDLRRLGIRASSSRLGPSIGFRVRKSTLDASAIISRMRASCEAPFPVRAVHADEIRELVVDGGDLVIDRIVPRIEFCSSTRDRRVFDVLRMLQAIPSPPLLYRQIAALVRDAGQPSAPLMGIFGLSSAVYSLRCRDAFLGWARSPQNKRPGMRSLMQLSVCMAVPPYNSLHAGKLVAALAASQATADEYMRKYGDPLHAIVTTCATGIHAPIFNRIMLKRGSLYRRIGATSGYSALFFSDATVRAARVLVNQRDGPCPGTTDRTIRTLKRALNICRIPRESLMKLAVPKGVYLAWPSDHSLRALADGTVERTSADWPRSAAALAWWKRSILPKALADPERMKVLREFQKASVSDRLGKWK